MDSQAEIGARLRRLRIALGHPKASTFCRVVGISDGAWNHYEHGRRRIAIDEALKVVTKTGASLDWIYRGLEHTLPKHLADKLHEAEMAERASQKAANG